MMRIQASIILLLLFLLGDFIKTYCFKSSTTNNLNNEVQHLEKIKASLYDNYIPLILVNEDLPISKNLSLKNVDYKKITLNELSTKNAKLVLRFNSYTCDECTNLILAKLKLLAKKIGNENIIILVSYDTEREFNITVTNKGIEKNAYLISEKGLGLSLEEKTLPYFFILDKEMKAKQVFLPVKELPEKIDEYLNIIYHKYFKKSSDDSN